MDILFDPGTVLITLYAWRYLEFSIEKVNNLVKKHVSGNHGEISNARRDTNQAFIDNGVKKGSIRSRYRVGSWYFLVITSIKENYTSIMIEQEKVLYPPRRKKNA